MTILKKELRTSRISALIWSLSVGLMILCTMLLYPEMAKDADALTDMFADMGSFSSLFGMDKLEMSTPLGYYGTNCGIIFAIGGGLFAALTGVGILSKEESDHTAEFLLAHPVSRSQIVIQKLSAVLLQLIFFNAVCILCSLASFQIIGETLSFTSFALFHLAQFVLQLEIAGICVCISAFTTNSGYGIGIGLTTILYFLGLLCNMSEKSAGWLQYITPYYYAEPSNVLYSSTIDIPLLVLGTVYLVIALSATLLKYTRKDITA